MNVEGGSSASIYEDFDQAKRIVQFIIKIDTLVKKESSETKRLVRQNREALIATFPPRRVWLSVKQLRSFEQDHSSDKTMNIERYMDEEDAVVDGKPRYLPNLMISTDVYSEPHL